jgi:hypothetical protein
LCLSPALEYDILYLYHCAIEVQFRHRNWYLNHASKIDDFIHQYLYQLSGSASSHL